MELKDIKQFFADNQDNDEVKAYLNELKTVSKDDVEDYLETTEGKKLLQPKLDKYFTKGLETWKEKNLNQLVEEKYNEKHPEETEEQKRIRQLEEKLNAAEKKSQREALKNKAINLLDEKGLPKKLADRFLGEDEDSTVTSITDLEETLNEWTKSKNKLRGNSPNPPREKPTGITREKFNKMSYSERVELYNENPEVYKQLSE